MRETKPAEAFSGEALLKLADSIISDDDRVNINTLSDELTISQVVKFFEKQGRVFTKTMIQNYLRVGVLPPPVNKRYYTRNHLVMLTLIDNLKSMYSLEEIRNVLAPVRNDPDIFDDDLIHAGDIYGDYMELRQTALRRWNSQLPEMLSDVGRMLSEDGVPVPEQQKAAAFMITLNIMAQSIAMKDLAGAIMKKYFAE